MGLFEKKKPVQEEPAIVTATEPEPDSYAEAQRKLEGIATAKIESEALSGDAAAKLADAARRVDQSRAAMENSMSPEEFSGHQLEWFKAKKERLELEPIAAQRLAEAQQFAHALVMAAADLEFENQGRLKAEMKRSVSACILKIQDLGPDIMTVLRLLHEAESTNPERRQLANGSTLEPWFGIHPGLGLLGQLFDSPIWWQFKKCVAEWDPTLLPETDSVRLSVERERAMFEDVSRRTAAAPAEARRLARQDYANAGMMLPPQLR